MNDGAGIGVCVIVFDTEDHAKAAVTPMSPEEIVRGVEQPGSVRQPAPF